MEPGAQTDLGPFRLRAFDSVHSAPNLTVRVEANGRSLCYSGDTGPNPHLVEAAYGTDVFLCEASWQSDTEVGFGPIHLRAPEAGRAARDAGAGRLLLTHLWPRLDAERTRAEAAAEFGGPAELASTGERTDI
jgi:ribonuclease BN (tRNA processing enzyme)